MRKLSLIGSAARVLTIFAACGVAYAANVNGRIKGSVAHPTGAALPNTPVTAVNQATGEKYLTTSSQMATTSSSSSRWAPRQ